MGHFHSLNIMIAIPVIGDWVRSPQFKLGKTLHQNWIDIQKILFNSSIKYDMVIQSVSIPLFFGAGIWKYWAKLCKVPFIFYWRCHFANTLVVNCSLTLPYSCIDCRLAVSSHLPRSTVTCAVPPTSSLIGSTLPRWLLPCRPPHEVTRYARSHEQRNCSREFETSSTVFL